MLDLGRFDHNIQALYDGIGCVSWRGGVISLPQRSFDLGAKPNVIPVRFLLGGELGDDGVKLCNHGGNHSTGRRRLVRSEKSEKSGSDSNWLASACDEWNNRGQIPII